MRQIKTYFILLLLQLVPVCVMAQRPAYYKMSPLVREACIVAQTHKAMPAKGQQQRKVPVITAFVKTGNPMAELSPDGCKILAQYGSLYIVSMPADKIASLSLRPDVTRIEAGRGNEVTMDTTKIIIGATSVQEGTNLPQAYTGKGVVIGIQDIGFDLTHPTFFSGDMSRYRIKAMWDQLSTDTLGSSLPVGRDYRDSVSLLSVGHPRDGLTQTHGTHTSGIAAGSGSEGTGSRTAYSGIAPDADICMVCNATSNDAALIPEEEQYKYTYAMDALGFKYIFDYADSVGKPCVINFSEGSHEDFRGDDALYYEMLDSLVGPGHIIVASAGNEGGSTNFVHKPQGTGSTELNVTGQWHRLTMSFTTRSSADFTLRLSQGGTAKDLTLSAILQSPDSTLKDSMIVNGTKYLVTTAAYTDCYDPAHTVAEWVISSDKYIYPKTFTLQLAGSNADVELYRGSTIFSNAPAGDNTHSILSPGSAPGVICVGMNGYRTSYINYLGNAVSYGNSTNGLISEHSSIGPTFDGRIKPDVVAPGQNIISSYSSFYIENNPEAGDLNSSVRQFTYNGRTYAWTASSGTSMASPVVTGTIALWLQANPRLTPQDCKDIFAQTCTHYDTSLTYPNNTYGYGQLDAYAGLQLALEKATGIRTVNGWYYKDDRIYTIDGRFTGNSLGLPKGIYIKGHRKIIVK